MSVFIGSTTPSQRACLSKEFKKLYAKKTFIPRKQKIAIALNTCDVGIKGVKELSTIEKKQQVEKLKLRIDNAFKQFSKLEKIYERTESDFDERKLDLLQKKISVMTGKLEALQDSLPFYLR
jgi:uncharacterized protein with ATP-grasp and redox domains